ncbi:MAG: malate synthase A [Betaproteobacteria bacterium]|jgi:malate synthase|nr:malate synthase A [Betaproteobacteria bacterium]MDH5342011.1 malate synthase A [Betaproteobacteria bacterium]
MTNQTLPEGIEILGPMSTGYAEILSPQAIAFVTKLSRKFENRRRELLELRIKRQAGFDAGKLPDFLPETKTVRESDWTIGAVPADLQDRRVEITGPTDRKMVINALNCGANVFMADFEDSNAPTWSNMIEGQINMRDAIRRTITFRSPEGKDYALNSKTATLLVRPRGWHLTENHMLVDGAPVSGAIFDFALYFFHNAKESLAQNTGPYFYLPKIESHLEARLWNDIFVMAQREMGVPQGTIKSTVLIETVLAAFEMDEILYELREHCVGLNIGRWDYIFSCIKKFRSNKDFCLADRSQVTMTAPFMRAYALLLIKTCHKRKAFAMGGMAAQIPIKDNAAANEAALAKVRVDKEREATDGCDGTWVAHPGLVGLAREIFDKHMPNANQVSRQRPDVNVTAKDLLDFKPEAPITEAGLRNNISVGIQYIGAWLAGNGCVPVYNLMEDAATAEISRSQIWQWMRSPKGVLEDGRKITREMFRSMLPEELAKARSEMGEDAWRAGRYEDAAKLFDEITTSNDYVEFLTLPGYEQLTRAVETRVAA